MKELSAIEREAMVAADRAFEFDTEPFEGGWLAAREFYLGKGYMPRSMLRAQAATSGICPICGADA